MADQYARQYNKEMARRLIAKELARDILLGPPPMKLIRRNWFYRGFMSYPEAEAYHLRQAAKLAKDMSLQAKTKQAEHLQQAELNRDWAWRELRGILEEFK
jgi:hypothetical protein